MIQEERIQKAAENIAQNLYDYAKQGREPEYSRYDEGYLAAIDIQGSFLVKEGIEWALSNQWISVDDELPSRKENQRFSSTLILRAKNGDVYIDSFDFEMPDENITHWMKIPPLNN